MALLDFYAFIFSCEDINECLGETHNDCDETTRADCTNLAGSYTCACKADFTATPDTVLGTSCVHVSQSKHALRERLRNKFKLET